MKIKSYLSMLFLMALVLLTGCNKEKMTTMSDDEISETVDGDLSESNGGSSTDLTSSARTAAVLNNSIFCGLTGDTTLTYTGPLGRYNWTATWTWAVNCTTGTPSSISVDNVGNATFDGTNLDLTTNFTGDFELTDLGNTTTEYNANGTSIRVGSGTVAVRNRSKEFTYTNTVVFTNVKITKSGYTIASGTAAAHCVGTVVDGNTFDRTAAIVFNGDGTYTVTLDNGNVYTFNLR